MRPNQIRLSTLMLTLLLAACATPVSTTVKPTEANLAKYNDLSALDVVTALEKNVNDAKQAGMLFLAPHYFREASQVLSESQSGLSNKPKEQLAQQAAKGDAILDKGRSVMSIVQYRFTKELELKSQLDKLNAAKLLPKEYEKVMGDFSGLIEKVEREQSDNIDKSKEALLKSLQELEVKAVQEGALRTSEVINNESKAKNAEKQIPATYAEALRIFLDAKTQIAAAPHDNELVVRLGTQALFAARHAQQLNDRVTELQAQFKGTAVAVGVGGVASVAHISTQVGGTPDVEKGVVEKIVLQEEDRVLSISTALGQKDLRDLTLDKQVQELKRAAADVVVQAKNEAGVNIAKNLEAKLQAANDATKKAMTELAGKDQQLATQATQLAEKDAEITRLNAQIDELKSAKKAPKAKSKRK
jgi:hypothetical protein